MTTRVDTAIIGAGTAGLAALREVRKQTDDFVIINDGPYGTTCARAGCMPSKALIEAAKAYRRRVNFDAFGIRGASALAIDRPAVLERVRRLRDEFVAGTLKATSGLGERNIPGRARFEAPDTLAVDDRRIRAERIIIATGSRPHVPEAWRALGDRVLTSDTLFEQRDLPPRMAVIGLGVIGAELGQALARLDIEVSAFGAPERIAGITDPEIRAEALAILEQEFAIHLGSRAELVLEDVGLRVTAGDASVLVDQALVAAGRRPNLDGLGLERLGIPLDERGRPPFDPETLQVADLPVFLAGDVNGRSPLLHEAADDGHIAGLNAAAKTAACHRRRTPLQIVFTDPGIARVGLPFSSLDPDATLTGAVSFARHGRARTAETNQGALRVYAERDSGRLLGAELCAPEGEHLAHLIALAIQRELTVPEFLGMPFYHPVIEEGLRTALRRIARELPAPPASDLSACAPFDAEALD